MLSGRWLSGRCSFPELSSGAFTNQSITEINDFNSCSVLLCPHLRQPHLDELALLYQQVVDMAEGS